MARGLQDTIEGQLIQTGSSAASKLVRKLRMDVVWLVDDVMHDPLNLGAMADVCVEGDAIALHYADGCAQAGLERLRASLRPEQSFGLWRLASLGESLCASLAEIHDQNMAQLVIHPGRIGVQDRRFMLLPTLSATMPPLGQVLADGCAQWLPFIAPEVLRRRGEGADLMAGDVFSLGRTLQFLTDPASVIDCDDGFKVAEAIVESPCQGSPWRELPALKPLHDILVAMTRMHGTRMSLADAGQAFRKIAEQSSPANRYAGLKTAASSEDVVEIASDLNATLADGLFPVERVHVALAEADACVAGPELDPARALKLLQSPELGTTMILERKLREARAWALHSQQPDHLARAASCYHWLHRQLVLPEPVVGEWATVLRGMVSSKHITDCTDDLMPGRAPVPILTLRARALIEQNLAELAWMSASSQFPFRMFDQGLFDLAREIAANVSSDFLVKWMASCRELPGQACGMAIAWERLGSPLESAKYLNAARMWRPPSPTASFAT